MNRASFDFIVKNDLWYVEGQVAAFKRGTPVVFPIESKEVKAVWKAIAEGDKPRFHWATGTDGKTYGLVALHMITKDLPNWTWAPSSTSTMLSGASSVSVATPLASMRPAK